MDVPARIRALRPFLAMEVLERALELEREGRRVLHLELGEPDFPPPPAAVEACQASRPDLAVLDVMMPGVSGLDAIRAIRADPALADLPVILLTARAQESDVETGFDSGADDYITKPFSPRELAARVEALLSRSG